MVTDRGVKSWVSAARGESAFQVNRSDRDDAPFTPACSAHRRVAPLIVGWRRPRCGRRDRSASEARAGEYCACVGLDVAIPVRDFSADEGRARWLPVHTHGLVPQSGSLVDCACPSSDLVRDDNQGIFMEETPCA